MLEKHQKVKDRESCFPRTYFAKSEQLCPKLLQCFFPSANNSSPEAFPAPSPSHGHPAGAPGVPAPLPSSPDLPYFWRSEGIRDPLGEGQRAWWLLLHTRAWLPHGRVGSWQGRDSGWRPRPAGEQEGWMEACPSHSGTAVGCNGKGGRGGEAAAIKRLITCRTPCS